MLYGTRSLPPTRVALIYRWTGNQRAVKLLPGHLKIESTARCPGVRMDDALAIFKQADV